jgi:class 3 adenylate cyclase
VPALFFQFFLDTYLSEKKQESLEVTQENARSELALLQKELDQKTVVEEAILRVQKDFSRIPDLARQDLETFSKLQKKFLRNFPGSSKLIWLSNKSEFIATNDEDFFGGKRSWESLDMVANGSNDSMARRIADNLIKYSISRHLDSEFIEQTSARPSEIVFKGQRFLFCRLKLSDRTLLDCGTLYAFLPLFNRAPNWLENRAIMKLSRRGIKAGIFFTSSNECIDSSTLSSNLLASFVFKHSRGKTISIGSDNTYCFSYLRLRKDVFVCVGVPHLKSSIELENKVLILKTFSLLPFFLTIAVLIILRSKTTNFFLSLKSRFKLTTIALSLVPIIVMIILGSMNSKKIGPEINRQRIENLRIKIDSIKEKTIQNLIHFEANLLTDLDNRFQTLEFSDSTARKIADTYAKAGCQSVFLLTPNAGIYYAKNNDKVKKSVQIRFLLGLLEWELKFYGFDFAGMRKQFSEMVLSESWGFLNRSFKFDTFIEFGIGNEETLLFSRLLYDKNRKVTGMATLVFNKTDVYRYLFFKAFNNSSFPDTRIFIKGIDRSLSLPLPKSNAVKEILDLAAFAGQEFTRQLFYRGQEFLVLGKTFSSLKLAIVGVTRQKTDRADLQKIFLFSLISTILLAILAAHYSFKTLNQRLLTPIQELSLAVTDVRQGFLGKTLLCPGKDEIAQLGASFNKMSLSLKEKADMKKFLNQDLIQSSSSAKSTPTRKKKAAVMFAGMRNFTELEKKLKPEESFQLMNLFLSTCEGEIRSHQGIVDKFIGDTVMCSFQDEEAEILIANAIACACSIVTKIKQHKENLPDQLKFSCGIGIALGEVIYGAIGSTRNRLDYTIIGDTVNLAARLEKLATKDGRPAILSSTQTSQPPDGFEFAMEKIESIKGKLQSVQIYSLRQTNSC